MIKRAVARAVAFWLDVIERIVSVQTVDRGVALGAQAFTAIVPLLMLYTLLAPARDTRDFASALIERFDLSGPSSEALREAFATTATTESSVSLFGALLLVVAATSFTRTLQRLYESAFGVPKLGFRGTPWGVLWIVLLAVPLTLRPLIMSVTGGAVAVGAAVLLSSLLWGVSPYILTARRITPWQAVPAGVLGGLAWTVFGVASTIYLPHSVAVSASHFGLIGVAFAFVSWLVAAGMTVAFSAVIGAVLAEHLRREPTTPVASGEPA